MNTHFFTSLVAALLSISLAHAQTGAGGAITTGTVTAVAKEKGSLTVLSEQTQRPINYTGMDKAVVLFASGKVATLADVTVGQTVTIEYAMRGRKPVVAKLLIPDSKPVVQANPVPLTPGERRALDSRALRDNDPTTQPGSKAHIDNDITTQPGKKDPRDPDITKTTDK